MLLPSRSTLAGGLAGLATWGISLLLTHFGIQIPQEQVGAAVAFVSAIVVHITPDSLKSQAEALNVKVEDLANWIPTIQATYPDQK